MGERLLQLAESEGAILAPERRALGTELESRGGSLELAAQLLLQHGIAAGKVEAWRAQVASAPPSPTGPAGKRLGARDSGRLPPEPRPAPAAPPAPRPGSGRLGVADGPSYPRSELCRRCGEQTTHTRNGCTRCMMREDNKKQGGLYVAIGGVLIAIAVVMLVSWLGARPSPEERAEMNRTVRRVERRTTVWFVAGAAFFLTGGIAVAGKGLRAMVSGANPEALS